MFRPIDITDIITAGGALRSDVNAAGAITAKNQAVAAQAQTLVYLNQTIAAGVVTVSPLARLSSAPTLKIAAFYKDPATKRIPWLIADDGSLFAKLNTASTAYAQIVAVAANPGTTVSNLNRVTTGAAVGSPAGGAFIDFRRDPATRKIGWGLQTDGTFFIGKYDATLLAAVNLTANNPALVPGTAPFFAEIANQIVAFYGSTQVALTSLGNNTKPKMFSTVVQFLSDRFRGVLAPYQMAYDGTNQRAVLRTTTYDSFFVTGQSLGSGETTAALTVTTPYPANALELTGGPVLAGTAISGTATVTPLVSSGKETILPSMAAALLDTELAQRATLKQMMFGNAYPGQAYAAIKQGTATYNDVLAQVGRILVAGTSIVRGFAVIHGESDAANVAYEANLVEWQANYETDIKALTGQKEPLYMFVSQTASIRYYYPVTLNAHKSVLAQLAASRDNNKIVLVVPDYIFTYNDNLHIDATSQRKKGEYFAKAYRQVVCLGQDWVGVRPKTFTLGANYIDIQFDVQVGALVLDTALATDPGNYGFTYVDGAANTISSVALKGGTTDTIRVTLSGNIGANAVIDYAYNNGTASTSGNAGGARGCLRDSDPAVSRWDASHLYNPCAIFKQALN